MKITDQIFFVTGSSSGLGRAAARRLHSLGARLALLDLAVEPDQVREYGADRVVGCVCDVRSEDDVKDAIAAVDRKWPGGLVGGLVMAAGVGMAGKVSRFRPSWAGGGGCDDELTSCVALPRRSATTASRLTLTRSRQPSTSTSLRPSTSRGWWRRGWCASTGQTR